jgi:hypothetical protein
MLSNEAPKASRRAILTAAPAAAAAALAGGAVANPVAIGVAKAGEVDPIFAVIEPPVRQAFGRGCWGAPGGA